MRRYFIGFVICNNSLGCNKKISFFVSVLFITNSTFGQAWIFIGNTKEKKDRYYISSRHISKEDYGFHSSLIRIWVKSEIAQRVIGKKELKNVECHSIWDIDCQKNQYRIEKLIVYDSAGIKIDQYNYTKEIFDLGIPGTISEKIIIRVCSLFK
jgi:hypothetical protein